MSVMVTVPALEPPALGLKVTLTLHEAPAATLEPQVLVWEKSPLIAMLVMMSVALPVFVSVKLCGLLLVPTACEANAKDAGETLAAGPPEPVPVRLTVCVAGLALSVMVRVPVLVPLAVGPNVTLMLQEVPAATLEPQVLVWEKSPLTLTPAIASVALPVLARVTL